MLGAFGAVTVVTMLLTFRRWPRFVPFLWVVFAVLGAVYAFGLP